MLADGLRMKFLEDFDLALETLLELHYHNNYTLLLVDWFRHLDLER